MCREDMGKATCLTKRHFEITTLHFTVVHRPTKVLCPWADFARGPNEVKERVAQKLNIFPCPLCLLFCSPWAAFSVLSSPGFCSPLSSLPLLTSSEACWPLFRRGWPQLKSKKHLQRSASSFLPSHDTHSWDTHLLVLAPLLAVLGLAALWGHGFLSLFWDMSSTTVTFPSFAPHYIQARFTPLAWWLLGTQQLFTLTAASLLCLAR